MIHQNIKGKRILLASQSPRRLELVKGLELDPVIRLKDVDESYPSSVSGAAVAEYVTRKKRRLTSMSWKMRIFSSLETLLCCAMMK